MPAATSISGAFVPDDLIRRVIQPSKFKPVDENELRLCQTPRCGGRRRIDMGVAIRPHERFDGDALAADLAPPNR